MKKQLHTCGNRCILNKHRNQCKYGFPFNSQLDQLSRFNKVTPIVGNITIQDMKIAMLCCTMNHCFFYGVPTSTSNALFLHIDLIVFLNIP
jgi:hypothetical protein